MQAKNKAPDGQVQGEEELGQKAVWWINLEIAFL